MALEMQGQFVMCSSEAVCKKGGNNEPLVCVGLTEKNEVPELNFTRSQSYECQSNNVASQSLKLKRVANMRPILPSINVSKPPANFNQTLP